MSDLRPVVGFEGLYSVSRDGRLWAHPRTWTGGNGGVRSHDGVWMRPSHNRDGYPIHRLCKGGRLYGRVLHRMVAAAWLPNPLNLKCVHHINAVKTDARVENLAWCTYSQNNRAAWKTRSANRAERETPSCSL